jgi:ParB-like chromosome segregation protein Spo0J
MASPTLQIEEWPVEQLIPYARNARTHSAQQVAQIAASIVEFGFLNPVLVDANGNIIAGHGRVLAARKLGMAHVPVIVLGHLSDNQK